MNNIKVAIIIVVLTIVIVGSLFYITTPREGDDVQYNVVEISSKAGEKLYLKKKVWGLTSDGQMIVITNNPEKNFNLDTSRQYVYNGVISFFYKQITDTLTVYVSKAAIVPSNLKSSIKVKQVELENPEMMHLIENDHFKELGLKTIH